MHQEVSVNISLFFFKPLSVSFFERPKGEKWINQSPIPLRRILAEKWKRVK